MKKRSRLTLMGKAAELFEVVREPLGYVSFITCRRLVRLWLWGNGTRANPGPCSPPVSFTGPPSTAGFEDFF